MADNSLAKSYYSVLILAFVCSFLVSAAAVGLRPFQEANRLDDRRKNILYAAGLYEKGKSVEELFSSIETRIVDLESGSYLAPEKLAPASFDQLKSALSAAGGRLLSADEDLAGIGHLEKYSLVYLVKENGKVSQVVLPVRGKGLWSTMYAYVAINPDGNTVRGVSFYEHGETPGLGGEIENRNWQAGWKGKQLYDERGQMALRVVKQGTAGASEQNPYRIDGLSGATLTTNGVSRLMEFWFGEHGFKAFLRRLREQDKGEGTHG